MAKATHNITCSIPGGWYGNDPGTFENEPKRGNVVVDPAEIELALRWLKRRARITNTGVTSTINPGVSISYELRR